MSEELDLFGEKPAAKKTAAKKTAAKKVSAKEAPVKDAPVKDRKAGWPIIWVDAVEGMPNYQEVGVNGEIFKIMREIEVAVPPSVVEVLRNSIGTRLVDTPHPAGGITRRKQQFSTIPWRLVGYNP
jgi:hypothetical protein